MTKLDKINALRDEMHQLEVEGSKLAWVQYTAGYDFGIEENYKKYNEFLQNKDHFNLIKEHKALELDELDSRKMDIMYKMFESYHKSDQINDLMLKIQLKTNELSSILNTYRFKIDGKEKTSVEITNILTTSEDRELRKKAYLARNQIDQPMVDGGFLDLVEMRKKLAKLNGFDTFVEMSLYDDELEKDIFDSWKDDLKEIVPEMNKMRLEYARKYLNDDIIYPWDEQYVRSQIAPSLSKKVDMLTCLTPIKKLFLEFGFNLDDYNITYDIYSRQNKSEWGYNFPIETGVDSRILANVKDRFYEYGVLLHETGHGVHSFLNDPNEKILNSGISGIVTEGIANLFGSLMLDENFYGQFFDEDLDKAREEFIAIKKWDKMNSLRSVVRILFDQEFYRRDNQSLDDIYDMYWDMNKELLGSDRGDFNPPCLFVIHHTTHPIYYHNYLMGDVTCEMLAEVFKEKHGVKRITDKAGDFGKFLYDEVVKPSGRYPYSELFKRISGKNFTLNYMK